MSRLLINIDMPDLKAGIAFYCDGLDFGLRRLLFDRSVAEMTFDGTRIFLIQQNEGSTAIPGVTAIRGYEAHWTPVHLDIVVVELDRLRLRSRPVSRTRFDSAKLPSELSRS